MAKKTKPSNEVTIKESSEEEYFGEQGDPYVLPPELNITIRDGFRFGIGFILAMLIFWAIVSVGVVAFLSFGLV